MSDANDAQHAAKDAPAPSLRAAIWSRRCLTMSALGFASGLPFAIANETSGVLLAEMKIDRTTIGTLGAIGSIYAFKFVWSPLVDAVPVPGLSWLGRRRSWLVATQVPMIAAIAMLAVTMPGSVDASLRGFLAVLIVLAILSATQDIVVNAWTVDAFPRREVGIGSAMSVAGYRVALLAGGAAAPVIAAWAGWSVAFVSMAALLGVGLVTTLLAPEPLVAERSPRGGDSLFEPAGELFHRLGAWFFGVVLLVLLLRLPDQLGNAMQKPLLLDTLGYAKEQYGVLRNGVGLFATLAGSFLGGIAVARFGMFATLVVGAILAALSNLGFAWLAVSVAPMGGTPQPWTAAPMMRLLAVGAFENLTGGMVATAFVAWLMSLCARRHAATQYAILSGAMAFSGGVASWASGHLSKAMSWPQFFVVTAVAGIPGLLLVPFAVLRTRPAED
ncbi:MAG: MFS transporter [Phycisphaerales bacterium]